MTHNHTSIREKRNISPEEIKELAEHLAARATPKHTKNQPARDRLILAASLLGILSFEHPNGLMIEHFAVKPTHQGEWGGLRNGSATEIHHTANARSR